MWPKLFEVEPGNNFSKILEIPPKTGSKEVSRRIPQKYLMSTAERALIDIAQDRRYWIIHSITIPSLFVGGVIFMLSGFVYKLFGALNFNKYFDKDNSSISLIKDRFSISSSMDDI